MASLNLSLVEGTAPRTGAVDFLNDSNETWTTRGPRFETRNGRASLPPSLISGRLDGRLALPEGLVPRESLNDQRLSQLNPIPPKRELRRLRRGAG